MKEPSTAKTVRTIGFMAIIIFCAKFLGLLREVIIAGVYGQGYASDVLNSATQIPLLFFDMTLGVAILSTFVPVFNDYLERDGRQRAVEFANSFTVATVSLALFFSLIGVIFAKQIVHIMAPGYDAAKVAETARLLRILFPSIIFTAVAYISVGVLQSFGEFNIPSLISVVSNLIMIAYLIFFGNKFGLTGVIVSMIIAWAAQLFVQLPYLKKLGFHFSLHVKLRDDGLLRTARLAVPVLISSWVQPLCSVINMAFGSSLGNGAVSGLNWANKIYVIMVGVFAYAVTNFSFPKLSRMNAGDDGAAFSETTRLSVGWVVYIIAYIAAMFIALSEPVIRFVFQSGAFTASSTALTANALLNYSVGMVGYAVCEILNKSFYAVQDGKTPMLTSIAGIAVNLASAALLVGVLKLGVGGLALASALSSSFMAIVLLLAMNKRKPQTFTSRFLLNLAKVLASGAASALAAALIYKSVQGLGDGKLITLVQLFASAFPALLLYIALSILLKTDEFQQIRRFINEK